MAMPSVGRAHDWFMPLSPPGPRGDIRLERFRPEAPPCAESSSLSPRS
jgi:hypothetical protein